MLGAIAGDIIGSSYEYSRQKNYDFELFTKDSSFTDDTVMTLAVAQWLIESESLSSKELMVYMQRLGRKYPEVGYGPGFKDWLSKDNPLPYYSYGNGSAMRVSPVGLYAQTLNEALELAYITASLSHNHPEGIKGAQATAASIYMARHKYSKQHIREVISVIYDYNLRQTIEEIRPGYIWNDYCQGSVPESIIAFLDGKDFEDVVRLAVSLGGDADTQAAIAGGIAACVYPIPEHIAEECERRLPPELLEIMMNFEGFIKSRDHTNK